MEKTTIDDEKEQPISLNSILLWVKHDSFVIFVLLLALGACAYTIIISDAYQQEINKVWLEQWEQSGCQVKPYQPNITFNYRGVYNEDKD